MNGDGWITALGFVTGLIVGILILVVILKATG